MNKFKQKYLLQTFSISQLSQFSGIKPHTIRIWEQRYNALSPLRSEGNTRFYDDNQLRRLLNIVSLQNHNFKISELCAFDDKTLYDLIEEKLQGINLDVNADYYTTQLISAGLNYREDNFDKLFTEALNVYGIKNLYINVLHPMLIRLGLMWSCDNIIPPQEHFICNLLKQKLYNQVESVTSVQKEKADWVLFLPQHEFHEMGLLMAHILIKQSGKKVIYLGANIPLNSFINTVAETGAKNVLLFAVHSGLEDSIKEYAELFFKETNNKNFYLTGNMNETAAFKINKKIKLLQTIPDLEKVIK